MRISTRLSTREARTRRISLTRRKARTMRITRRIGGVPAAASPPPQPTGKAAAEALQEHIRHHGTQDVKTIDRLRRASLQPDSPNVGAQAQGSDAAAMAAAIAAVDAEEEQEADGSVVGGDSVGGGDTSAAPEPVSSAMSAKRQEIDALYAKHNPEKLKGCGDIITKYKAAGVDEPALLEAIRKKYGRPALAPIQSGRELQEAN